MLIYPGKAAAKKDKESKKWAMMTQKMLILIYPRKAVAKRGRERRKRVMITSKKVDVNVSCQSSNKKG